MRILVVSNLYPPDVIGGYELGCRQAVEALRRRGHEVRVLTSAPRLPPLPPPEPHVRRALQLADVWSHTLFIKRLPVNSKILQAQSNYINAQNVHTLLAQIEEFRPDVAYLWMLVGLGGLGLVASLNQLRVPWVWHLMDEVPVILCKSDDAPVPVLVRECNRQLRGIYLGCSRQLLDRIEAAGIELRDEAEVIPNWVAGTIGPPRRSYLPDGQLRIISAAGQIGRRVGKGIDLVVEAAARLRERSTHRFVIDLYGHVADESIPTLIRRHDLGDRVFLRGPRAQDELAGLFAEYDLFAFPTLAREPFAFAPLEAAVRGCVPVMSQLCGNSEWLVHGVHCLKAARTPGAFADVFAAALDGAFDLGAVGRRVAAVIRRDFHLDAVIPRIEAALARAAGRPRLGAASADDVYRMAVLAERLAQVMHQEPLLT